MNEHFEVQPLPYKKRRQTFLFLVLTFLVSLPFLYLYATGYRFDLEKPTNLVSTGGIYITVERTGAEIYIDGELVRETRTFKKAFYAQNIDSGTHRVHVQKDGYHTWVKELPVSKRLVTEAEAFNLPLVPQVRVISEWVSATGSPVVRTPLMNASTSQSIIATTTIATSTLIQNEEFMTLVTHFASSTEKTKKGATLQIKDMLQTAATSSAVEEVDEATSTIEYGGVRLAMKDEDLYATWIGSFEQMPYYYCAPEFPAYSTTSTSTFTAVPEEEPSLIPGEETDEPTLVMHPVQTVPKDVVCDPSIRIDRKWQTITDFDFLLGNTDFVVVALNDGVYVVEVDDRSWQNVQPLMLGENLHFYIENGSLYIFDGYTIYQVLFQVEEVN